MNINADSVEQNTASKKFSAQFRNQFFLKNGNYSTGEFPCSIELQYYPGVHQLNFGDRTGSSVIW